jgi:PKD repeat protein
MIVFLLTVAVAATPASGGEPYAVAATMVGDATYMALNPDGTFSDQEDMLLDHPYLSLSSTAFGNGIGDFNNDGELDYIAAFGLRTGDIYVFPKSGPGNQFDTGIWVGAWTEGFYPADMAVADFNGDGNLDFVLNFWQSTNCVLYLGDGAFGFTSTVLTNTTPVPSVGMDAADFNNDGIADFVVAPNRQEPFHVFLGRGDGTFDAVPVHGSPSNNLAGIAAADFIQDPDGNVDLAISGKNILEIYTGNGNGTFEMYNTYSLPVNSSLIDNGDFNRDGYQDLIVADYGGNSAVVAVLNGDGKGNFELSDTLTGGPAAARKALAALPYLDNKAPVARLTPEVINVTVGETVEWDASESFDEDGTIVCYEWDYGDGMVRQDCPAAPSAAAATYGAQEAPDSYVYYDSGEYTVTLTVTDDKGATATVQADVNVEALPVSVYFSPRKLNLKSKGKWVTATIRVPAEYDARGINSDNLFLMVGDKPAMAIPAHKVYPHKGYPKHHKKKYRRIRTLKAKFDRQALIGAIGPATGKTTLTVTGEISTSKAGLEFAGTGNIEAYEKKDKKSFRSNLWKHILYVFSKGKSR